MNASWKNLVILSIAVMLFLTQIQVLGEEQHVLRGHVRNVDGNPLPNVKIYVFKQIKPNSWKLNVETETSIDGSFEVQVSKGSYRIYAVLDYNSTPGFDYAISYLDVEVEKDVDVNLTLIEGASILLEGEALVADSAEPAKYVTYEVEGFAWNGDGEILSTFGAPFTEAITLGLPKNAIIVPANLNVMVTVEATFIVDREMVTKKFNLTEKSVILRKGEELTLSLPAASLKFSVGEVRLILQKAIKAVEEAEERGFYMAIYRLKISRAEELIAASKEKLAAEAYDACYVDLREAYAMITSVISGVNGLFAEAVSSSISIAVLIALTSVAIGELLFEKRFYKISAAAIAYAAAIYLFYELYPGCRLVDVSSLLMWSAGSLLIASALTLIPQKIKEEPGELAFWSALVSIFSIAKRNLKRRKLRTLLTLISVLVLTGGFVALTSISIEEGLSAKAYRTDERFTGIVVDKILPPISIHRFIPLEQNFVDKFALREKAQWISIKYMNAPQLKPIDYAVNPLEAQQRSPIFGVLAFSDSRDPIFARIKSKIIRGRIVEASGEVVLTQSMASTLEADINSTIIMPNINLEAIVVGIVSDDALSIIDFDDRQLTPLKMQIVGEEEPTIEIVPCEAGEIIFVWWGDATKLGALPVRLAAKIEDDDKAVAIAKRIALAGDYRAKAYAHSQVMEFIYGSYLEVKGLEAMITLAISVLNVSLVMLSSVYERRREVATLSALGLNPSHITMLFTAEASIIGVVAGGLGYLLGLAFYRIANFLNMLIEVYPKVSASWTTATISIAVITSIAGAIPALKSSVIVTPSRLMKWKADIAPKRYGEPWIFIIPVKIDESEVNEMLQFVFNKLKSWLGVEGVKFKDNTIRFRYSVGRGTMGASSSANQFIVERDEKGEIKLKLIVKSYGENPEKHAHDTASLVRSIILRWRTLSKR